MNQPISHKLAPFINTLAPACDGPIAGYASYCTSPPFLFGEGDFGLSKSGEGLLGEHLHLENNADFMKTVLAKNFDQLLDIFCVDHDTSTKLFYFFRNSCLEYRFILTLDIQTNFHVPSLSSRYASADWLERECFDLFGIQFEDHPHLKRLIMYPEFAGNPLRKVYPIDKPQPLIPIYA